MIRLQRHQQVPVKFLFIPQLKPVVLCSMFWIWHLIGSLRTDVNLLSWGPVILALRVAKQNSIVRVTQFECIFLICIRIRYFVRPGVLRREASRFAKDFLISGQDAQGRSRNILIHIQTCYQRILFPAQVNHPDKVCP